jgi:hypothetical protein
LDDDSTKEEKTAENSGVSDPRAGDDRQQERKIASEIKDPPVPSPLGSKPPIEEAAEASCPLPACLESPSPIGEAAEASCPPVPEPLGSRSPIGEAEEASFPHVPPPLGSKSRIEEAAEASGPPGKEGGGTACDKCNYVTFCKECLPRHRYSICSTLL